MGQRILCAALAAFSIAGGVGAPQRFLIGGHGPAVMSYEHYDAPRLPPGSAEALAHLRTHGYVVLASVFNESELDTARSLLWSFLEGAGKGVNRSEPESWHQIHVNRYGICWSAGQSEFMWFIRSAPRLVAAFAAFWNVPASELLASFEGFGAFPPVELERTWSAGGLAEGWFHTDQNGLSRPGLWTIQSFTSLHDQDEATGAFVVVPGSHLEHDAVTRRAMQSAPGTPAGQQFLMVASNDPILTARPPKLIRCKAGDTVLWDSRTVHCNTPSLRSKVPWRPSVQSAAGEAAGGAGGPASPPVNDVGHKAPLDLLRVAAYVSMAPRARATDEVLRLRRRAVLLSQACTHWPFEATCIPPEQQPPPPPDLNELQLSLAGLSPEDGRMIAEARRVALAAAQGAPHDRNSRVSDAAARAAARARPRATPDEL